MEHAIEKAMVLLNEKKIMFEDYEAITDKLSETADIDTMEDYITKRAELAIKIDELDDIIANFVEVAFDGGGQAALNPNTQRENLLEELRKVYDVNLTILNIIRRIRLKNTDITSSYQRLRGEMAEKIKESSNMPKINKYLNNLSTPTEVNNFGSV